MTPPSGDRSPRRLASRYWWVGGLLVVAAIVVVLAPLASPDPDGLERVAEDHGFLGAARDALYSIIPDYVFPGLTGNAATILAGATTLRANTHLTFAGDINAGHGTLALTADQGNVTFDNAAHSANVIVRTGDIAGALTISAGGGV